MADSVFSGSHRVRGIYPHPIAEEEDPVEEEDNDDASEDDESYSAAGSTSSSRRPSKEALDVWNDTLDLSKEPIRSTFGPKVAGLMKRWGGDTADSFRAPRMDPSLLHVFSKAKQANKSLVESSTAVAASSGAAAHAITSAMETVECWIAEIEKVAPTQEGGWKEFFQNMAASLKNDAAVPLNDALKLQAASYGKAVAAVRNGVVAAAEAPVKEVLKITPPSNGFFFGDPAERLNSSMGYALMSAQLQQASSSSSRGGRGGAASSLGRKSAAKSAASAKKSAPSSSSPASSSSSRPFARGRGGKGKK